ncbi:hypothetical protein GF312_15785 [Candidatus Poribacteria bacterium]|nr:hypothetical protein [Candidatus Poribacteria bacterium]
MGKWTRWRKQKKAGRWFGETFDNNGPSCYELGLKAPNGKTVTRFMWVILRMRIAGCGIMESGDHT